MKSVQTCLIHDKEKVYNERHKKYECRDCKNEYAKQYREKNAESIRLKNKEYNASVREKRQEWIRQDRINNPEKWKKYKKVYSEEEILIKNTKRNIKKYNLSLDQYKQMIIDCNDKCLICKKDEIRKTGKGKIIKMSSLSIDHCHETGKVRGLLCFKCNIGLGKFNEDIEILKSAIAYLESHEHK